MKIHMSLNGINDTIKSLEEMGLTIPGNVKTSLIDSTNEIRDRAKAILEEQSESRTGKKYWTGRLQNAIKTEIVTDETDVTGTRVGVDLRDPSIRYAEWVEVGHRIIQWHSKTKEDIFVGSGAWWEGYHYLESAYLEVSPTIGSKITDTVRESFRYFSFKGGRTRNVRTGRFSKGTNYITVS